MNMQIAPPPLTHTSSETHSVNFYSSYYSKRHIKTEHIITIGSQQIKLKVYKPSDVEEQADNTGQRTELDVKKHQESSAVVLENLPDDVKQDVLTLLVENITSLSENDFTIELIRKAVVTFKNPSDAGKFLVDSRTHEELKKKNLRARTLERSTCVRVENLPTEANNNKMLLELYFEKWGGPVEEVITIPSEQAAIITFKEEEAKERILKQENNICDVPVKIYPYFKSLDTVLYGGNRPHLKLPDPITVSVHPAIREFLLKKGEISSIKDQMNSHFCQINMDKPEVLLSPDPALLKQKRETRRHMDGWSKNACDAFMKIMSNYTTSEWPVSHPLWSKVESDVKELVKDKVFTDMDASKGVLTLAGMTHEITGLKLIMEKILERATNQIEIEKNSVTEQMEMSPAMYSLLLQEGLKSAVSPNLHIDYNKKMNRLNLSGLHTETLAFKNWVLEKKINMKQKTLKIDRSILEFLRSVNCDEMSTDLFISHGITAVYTIENEDVIVIGSTEKALVEAEKRVNMVLTSKDLIIEDQGVLQMPEWQDRKKQLQELFSTSKNIYVFINLSQRNKVIVTGFRDPVMEVSENLECFIEKHTRIEETVRVKSHAAVSVHPAIREFLLKKGEISSIKDQMSSHFCQINMDKPEVLLSPDPALLKQKRETRRHMDDWSKNACDAFMKIMSNYTTSEWPVSHALWSKVESDVKELVKDKVFTDMDASKGVLTLAGMTHEITGLKLIMEKILERATNQIEIEKNSVTEQMEMSPAMYSLLLQEGLKSAVSPNLHIDYNKKMNRLNLSGLHTETLAFKNWVLEKKINMKQKTLKIDRSILEFLRSVNCDEMSTDLFISHGITAVYTIENEDVVLFGSTEKALVEAEKRVNMVLTSKDLIIEDQGVLQMPEWQDRKKQLQELFSTSKNIYAFINLSQRNKVIVTGFRDPVMEVSENLECFIEKHTRIEETVRVKSHAAVEFIKDKKSQDWKHLMKSDEVKVNFDSKRPWIKLSGERGFVQPAMTFFKRLADSLHTDTHIIKKAGAKKYFKEQGKMMLSMLLKEKRFVVVLQEDDMLEQEEDVFISETPTNQEFVVVCEEIEPAVLQLCGETPEDLREAKDMIHSIIVREHLTIPIRDPSIAHFTKEDVEMLNSMQREFTVSVQLEKKGQDSVVTLEGLTRDVHSAERRFRDMIRKVERNEYRRREAFIISSVVNWQYLENGRRPKSFDMLTNYELEQAYQNRQPSVRIKINNDDYEANLVRKEATRGRMRIELNRVDLVLVGDFTQGKRGLPVPLAKSSNCSDLYNSVTDNINNPNMFVIFNDVQAYPEYLITFQ
ncbi:Poly [ADP-ribose] polymerase 14 [Anabarilius grahami]|uniref:Poly [ADP-ribose] polymerase 14 n=1 Tax=Anabarilius grahami TaxID=495550 RepID=A0A3N0Z804_ANAGA|nr:Poly [ADP-ribose] polymerase 14 [Anabarilius grahami]